MGPRKDAVVVPTINTSLLDRCDKCGTPVKDWSSTPCKPNLVQSPQHSVTRLYLGEIR